MVIIYKRWGILVLFSGIIAFGILKFVLTTQGSNINDHMHYFFFFAALLNFLTSRFLLSNEYEKDIVNPKGRMVKVNNYSSLFYIRNKYWTFIYLIAGIAFLLFSKR